MAQGTSKNVRMTGRRVLATILDGAVLGGVGIAMAAVFGTISTQSGSVDVSLERLPAVVFFVLVLAYYVVLEGYLGGTVGKMVVGIKVIREDTGAAPGPAKAALRTVARLVDGLLAYLVAFVAVVASPENKRLGDMLARTFVVRR